MRQLGRYILQSIGIQRLKGLRNVEVQALRSSYGDLTYNSLQE